jgi:hypothetical protein
MEMVSATSDHVSQPQCHVSYARVAKIASYAVLLSSFHVDISSGASNQESQGNLE